LIDHETVNNLTCIFRVLLYHTINHNNDHKLYCLLFHTITEQSVSRCSWFNNKLWRPLTKGIKVLLTGLSPQRYDSNCMVLEYKNIKNIRS